MLFLTMVFFTTISIAYPLSVHHVEIIKSIAADRREAIGYDSNKIRQIFFELSYPKCLKPRSYV